MNWKIQESRNLMKMAYLSNNGVLKEKGPGEFTPLLEHLEVDSKRDMIFMVDGLLILEFKSLIPTVISQLPLEPVELVMVNCQSLNMLILTHQEMCMLWIGVISVCKYFLLVNVSQFW